MKAEERFVEFECCGAALIGVLHCPENPSPTGIVLIGRTGSDRIAVHLGRAAAARGIAVFRFDFRGRGDCEGPLVAVEETGDDLACAIEAFRQEAPEIQRVVIWGLSEGAASALLYCARDSSVAGLILVNPWIRMEKAVAKQHMKQNLSRILERDFWARIGKSESGYLGAARSFLALTGNLISASLLFVKPRGEVASQPSLKDRLMESLTQFRGPIRIILSGGDPATAIFQDAAKKQLGQLALEGRLSVMTEPDANHVFSRSDWREHMIQWSVDWVNERYQVPG